MADQTWLVRDLPTLDDVAAFLNVSPRQGPGEATVVIRPDGSHRVFYLAPGSLGTGTQQTWDSAPFSNGDDAAKFLNTPPKEGKGEMSAVLRDFGDVDLLYLHPGSEKFAEQVWDFQGFESREDVLSFINDSPRPEPGQLSVVVRADGSVGFFDQGGGGSDSRIWEFHDFPSAQDAVTFMNDRQLGPGEVSVGRDDGSVTLVSLTGRDPALP